MVCRLPRRLTNAMEIAFTIPAWLLWAGGIAAGGFILGLAAYALVLSWALRDMRWF